MGWEQGGEHFLNVSKQLNSVYSSKRFIPFISSIMAVLGKDVRACVCVCFSISSATPLMPAVPKRNMCLPFE